MSSPQIVIQPAVEPISLAEAKDHLRVDGTDEDTLIALLITAARSHIEDYTRRALITQTVRLTLDFLNGIMYLPRGRTLGIDAFYYIGDNGDPAGAVSGVTSTTEFVSAGSHGDAPDDVSYGQINWLTGDNAGSRSVVSSYTAGTSTFVLDETPENTVQVGDTYSAFQLLDSSIYQLDNQPEPARLWPVFGGAWPSLRADLAVVEIQYRAGYGPRASDVPGPLKHAILLMLSHLYENREATSVTQLNTIPYGVLALAYPYRMLSF